jgi:hypothetical protein
MRATMRALNPSECNKLMLLSPRSISKRSRPPKAGGRRALRACPAEPITALRAAMGPFNRRGDNYPDT